MKKNYFLGVVALVGFLSANAQSDMKVTLPVTGKSRYIESSTLKSSITPSFQKNGGSNQVNAVIWANDFSTPADWTISNEVGNTDDWVIGTGAPSGSFPIPAIASTTAANGFALFDSDLLCSFDQIADLTTTNSFSCTGNNIVKIDFQEYYRRFYDSTNVLVSTDNINWTAYSVNTNAANNQYNTGQTTGINPTTVTVDISATAANQATVWIRFQFYSPAALSSGNSGCAYSWMIDDISVYEPAATDAGVIGFAGPFDGCSLTANEQVSVGIVNFGGAAISGFPVTMSVDGGAPITETVSGSINPGDTLIYTFTATADLSAAGAHSISSYTGLSGDANAANDSSSYTVTNLAPANPSSAALTMGFELTDDLTGWSVADMNGDGVSWALVNNTGAAVPAHSGDYCLRRAGSGSDDDDWLFSKCIDLNAGTNYQVECYYKVFDQVAVASFDVAIGAGADEASMTQILYPSTTPIDTTWQHVLVPFTVAANGTYFLGFQSTSALGTGTSSIRLDDINISIVTGINNNSLSQFVTVSPNPSKGILNITSKLSGEVKFALYNSLGQEVYNNLFASAFTTKINLSKFDNGIYTLRLTSNNQQMIEKIILNK